MYAHYGVVCRLCRALFARLLLLSSGRIARGHVRYRTAWRGSIDPALSGICGTKDGGTQSLQAPTASAASAAGCSLPCLACLAFHSRAGQFAAISDGAPLGQGEISLRTHLQGCRLSRLAGRTVLRGRRASAVPFLGEARRRTKAREQGRRGSETARAGCWLEKSDAHGRPKMADSWLMLLYVLLRPVSQSCKT